MKKWAENLKEKSCVFESVSESLILSEIPPEYINDWDNFMRGKTCPVLENGDHGVYVYDLQQFLFKYG